jgi:archaellum component FlaF (FlaF/FlaG flagellin family)
LDTAITWVISFFLVVTTAFAAITTVVTNGSNRSEAIAASDQSVVEELESSFKIVDIYQSTGHTLLHVVITNDGRRSFQNFEDWEIVVKYDQHGAAGETILAPTYTDTLVNGTWIDFEYWLDYDQDDPALIEQGILNIHEEMEIQIQVDPKLEHGTYLVVTITSPSGITESATLEA